LAESFDDLAESFDPLEVPDDPPEGELDAGEDGEEEDESEAVLDFASAAAEDFSPDSLLRAFFRASDG